MPQATSSERHLALVAAGHELGDGAQRGPPHGAGGAHEQRLDLDVVEPRRVLAQVAAGLEVEVLRVVVGHAGGRGLGLGGGGVLLGAAPQRRRQVGQHLAHAHEMPQRRARLVLHRRIEPVAHGQRIAHQQLGLVGQQLLRRGHRAARLVAAASGQAGSVRQSTTRLSAKYQPKRRPWPASCAAMPSSLLIVVALRVSLPMTPDHATIAHSCELLNAAKSYSHAARLAAPAV